MAVSVRIEDEAFGDERYEDLATIAGLADADHARGKMARLWRQCTLESTYFLPVATVVRVLGPRAIEALETARLGEMAGEDRVRIRGTEGRIEWLQKLRDNGKFGRLGAEHGRKGGRPRKTPPKPRLGVTENPPPAPAPAPAPAPPERESPARAPANPLPPEPPKTDPARAQPPAITTEPEIQKAISATLREVDAARARVAARFGWSDVLPLDPTDGRGHLRERILESGGLDVAAPKIKHVLAIAEAEAIAKRTVEYLGGAMFKHASWSKKLTMRLDDARRTPGPYAAPAPANKITHALAADDSLPPMPLAAKGRAT